MYLFPSYNEARPTKWRFRASIPRHNQSQLNIETEQPPPDGYYIVEVVTRLPSASAELIQFAKHDTLTHNIKTFYIKTKVTFRIALVYGIMAASGRFWISTLMLSVYHFSRPKLHRLNPVKSSTGSTYLCLGPGLIR